MPEKRALVNYDGVISQILDTDFLRLVNQPIQVTVTNRTGATLVGKECVIIDSANDYSVVFSALAADKRKAMGIVTSGGINGAQVVVQINGIATAVAGGIITRSDIVEVNTAGDGRVVVNNAANTTGIGKALTSAVAGGDVDIILGTV